MSELSRDARALVQQTRGAGFPTPEQLANVRSALDLRLAAVGAASTGVLAPAASGVAKLVFVAIVGVGAGLVGGWSAARSRRDVVSASSRATHAVPTPAAVSASSAVPGPTPTPRSAPTPLLGQTARAVVAAVPLWRANRVANRVASHDVVEPVAATTAPAPTALTPSITDGLSAESELLAAAERGLASGDATHALALLAEHERRFPEGVLTEERTAARATALCALGRFDEARPLAVNFLVASARSPYAARVRAACGLGMRR